MFKSTLTLRSLYFGFMVWLIPFVLAIPIFQPLSDHRIVFKSIMGVILVTTVSLLWASYLKKIDSLFRQHAVVNSLIWTFMSIIIDLFAFIIGFKMDPIIYFTEIAISYLAIPVILLTSATILERKLKNQ